MSDWSPYVTVNSDSDLQQDFRVSSDSGLAGLATGACESVCTIGRLQACVLALCTPAGDIRCVLSQWGLDPVGAQQLVHTPHAEAAARRAFGGDRFVEVQGGELVAVAGRADGLDVLMVGRREPRAWPSDSCLAQVLEATVDMTALAIAERQAAVQREKLNAARQRTKLVQSIHDDVVQRLFGVTLALQDEGPMDDDLREICAVEVERALGDLRHVLQAAIGDRPAVASGSLSDGLDDLATQGAVVDAHYDQSALDAAQESVVCAVLAEAVRNARKHALPQSIAVAVGEEDGLLSLAVTNDGVPASRVGHASRGVGLQIASAEAAQAGGVLEHGPNGLGRWKVRLVLPMEERDDCTIGGYAARGARR